MKFDNLSMYKRYSQRKKTEDIYRGGESLFQLCRESDLKDIRKVWVNKVKPLVNDNEMESGLYYGMEDAMRTLYRKGGQVYNTKWDLRLKNKDGNIYVFHRIDKNLLPLIDEITLDAMFNIGGMNAYRKMTLYKPVLDL